MRSFVALAAAAVAGTLAIAPPALAEDEGRFELGREVFVERAEPPCALCHTLADAGADGTIGPSLDTMRPDHERVMRAVAQGVGVMPAYGDLDEDALDALAHYVSTAAGD